MNDKPQKRTNPFPILRGVELGHLEFGPNTVGQPESSHGLQRQLSFRIQLDLFNVSGPGWPLFDLGQMLPGNFEGHVNFELALDEVKHISSIR